MRHGFSNMMWTGTLSYWSSAGPHSAGLSGAIPPTKLTSLTTMSWLLQIGHFQDDRLLRCNWTAILRTDFEPY